MKKAITTLIATSLVAIAPFAAAQCGPNSSVYPVRIKTHTVGAINQETYKILVELLKSNTLEDLKKNDSLELKKLYTEHLVQNIEAGRVVCADSKAGFFDYAKRVHLEPEGFSVWVREADTAKFD